MKVCYIFHKLPNKQKYDSPFRSAVFFLNISALFVATVVGVVMNLIIPERKNND